MKNKIFLLTLFFLFLNLDTNSFSKTDRQEKEIKLGVFLDDLKEIGKFDKISKIPEGLFDEKYSTFESRSTKAQDEVGKIFVKQKGLLEKYPDRMMLGMAYFEFFYMRQLKENNVVINRFKDNYPSLQTKQTMQKIYNLNQARKTMREALGLKISDDPSKAIATYVTMHKLFSQSENKINKLSKEEKKKIKLNNTINKEIGVIKKTLEKYQQQRITQKKFLKDYRKIHNKLDKTLKKNEVYKEYELLRSLVVELPDLVEKNLSAGISGYKLSEFIIKDIKKNTLPKKFTQDLSKANFKNFSENELKMLGEVTKFTKNNKNIKSNEIQIDILNLEDNGLPVNKLLDVYREDLSMNLESLNMQLASIEEMNRWALSDWANSWKSPIPTKVTDVTGIEVNLSSEQIEEIKAQLAMQNFKEILNIDDFKNIISQNTMEDIQASINQASDAFNFSFTLDDFAKALGDLRGLDLNNYADLTELANAQHGANWSVEEYASAYQDNLDVIEQLAAGSLSDFDAGQLASAAGASLQEVADTIAAASAAGVTVDLDATMQGMGYSDFAAAVAAYNEQYGTNYTVDQARDALGQ